MKKKKPLEGAVDEVREQALLKIFDQLDKMSNSELVRIGDAINGYEWLADLPSKPNGWEEMSRSEKHTWAGPILEYITTHVGEKALLRHLHKTKFDETDQEFEDWWDSHNLQLLKEQQKEFYNRYYGSCRCDRKRYYCGLFVEAMLFFALGLLTALFLR